MSHTDKHMILTFLLLLLLFSNGLSNKPDTSILYKRIGILIVFYSLVSCKNQIMYYKNELDIIHLNKNYYILAFVKFFNIFFYIKGYSLIGKTANLHFVNLGSSPDVSICFYKILNTII